MITTHSELGSGRRNPARYPPALNKKRIKTVDIYVGNIPYDLTDDELMGIFGAHGEVTSAKVIIDRETGRSKGFAFVAMANEEEANAAVDALNGADIGGRPAKVNIARPREERPPRRDFGGGGGGFNRGGGGGGGFNRGGGGGGGYRGDRDGGGRDGGFRKREGNRGGGGRDRRPY
ncbi:MAG: RNA recognition motif domain-containing protein [Puniceicoccales bacterium]